MLLWNGNKCMFLFAMAPSLCWVHLRSIELTGGAIENHVSFSISIYVQLQPIGTQACSAVVPLVATRCCPRTPRFLQHSRSIYCHYALHVTKLRSVARHDLLHKYKQKTNRWSNIVSAVKTETKKGTCRRCMRWRFIVCVCVCLFRGRGRKSEQVTKLHSWFGNIRVNFLSVLYISMCEKSLCIPGPDSAEAGPNHDTDTTVFHKLNKVL